jgi:hypothetical protein
MKSIYRRISFSAPLDKAGKSTKDGNGGLDKSETSTKDEKHQP